MKILDELFLYLTKLFVNFYLNYITVKHNFTNNNITRFVNTILYSMEIYLPKDLRFYSNTKYFIIKSIIHLK